MIEKVTHVPIVVSDQDRALRFYTEVLGLEKRADYQLPGNPRWLTIGPKGQDLELILVVGEHAPSHPKPGTDHGGNHTVFKTDDCRNDVERLKARGVKFKGPAPTEANFGLAAYFTDPDGNHLTLLQPARGPGQKG
jgi:predicted enzyme related to lactoylglutathione lyase